MKFFKSLLLLAAATFFAAAMATECEYYYDERVTRVRGDRMVTEVKGYYLINDKNEKGSFYYSKQSCFKAATECKQIEVAPARYVSSSAMGVPYAEDRGLVKVEPATYIYRLQDKPGMSGAKEYTKSFKTKSECSSYQDHVAMKRSIHD